MGSARQLVSPIQTKLVISCSTSNQLGYHIKSLKFQIFYRNVSKMPGYNVEEEIAILSGHIKRLGRQEGENHQVTFKELFDDDEVANTLESLAGTLKAAKKKKGLKLWTRALAPGNE